MIRGRRPHRRRRHRRRRSATAPPDLDTGTVVVDSTNVWSSNYTLTLTCASNGENDCQDGIDNDQDSFD